MQFFALNAAQFDNLWLGLQPLSIMPKMKVIFYVPALRCYNETRSEWLVFVIE